MTIVFNKETFRDDYTFYNTPEQIKRFPFPFPEDDYMYSVNLEPHTRTRPGSVFENTFDVDGHYISEMKDRALVLEQDPLRCQSMPHMTLAGWDFLELVMESKSAEYPELFELHKDGKKWTWINKPLEIEDTFVFGKEDTLPCGPLEYIGRQTQGDIALLDQRENNLWMDAGIVTTQADWSLDFDVGMNFMEWHAPVPIAHNIGVFERALKFLLNIQQGAPIRRFNWTMTANPLLDTSPERYHEWGVQKSEVNAENVGKKMHLRVELQTLFRLPRSNALAFPIRCYLINLEDLVTIEKWARRFHRVIRDLPVELATYKGFIDNRPTIVEYLSQFDDGGETTPGIWPFE